MESPCGYWEAPSIHQLRDLLELSPESRAAQRHRLWRSAPKQLRGGWKPPGKLCPAMREVKSFLTQL